MSDWTTSGDQIASLCARAEALCSVRRYGEAIALLQQAVAAAPDDARPHCWLAFAFEGQQEYRAALEAANRAVAFEPDNEWAHRLRSASLAHLGKRRQALAAAREAVRLDPQGSHALLSLAARQLDSLRLRDARRTAELLREIAPEWPETHEMLGSIALQGFRWKEAEAHSCRALELNPQSWLGLNNLGRSLQQRGKTREAIECFDRAAQINPAEAWTRQNLLVAVNGYVGEVASIVIAAVVLGVALLAIPEAQAISLPLRIAGAVALLAGGIAAGRFLWRRRTATLPLATLRFYQDHDRREWEPLLRALPLILTLSLTVVWTAAWFGPFAHQFLNPWGISGYLLSVGATVALTVAAVRRWQSSRR